MNATISVLEKNGSSRQWLISGVEFISAWKNVTPLALNRSSSLCLEAARCDVRVCAFVDNLIVGFAFVSTKGCDTYVSLICSFQKGAGRAIMTYIEKKVGSGSIRLRSTSDALPFYTKLGYVLAPPVSSVSWSGQQFHCLNGDTTSGSARRCIHTRLLKKGWVQDKPEFWVAKWRFRGDIKSERLKRRVNECEGS